MRRDDVIAKLRQHEPELRAAGIASLSLFGSVARGDDGPESDVDVVVKLTDEASRGGFAYYGRLQALTERLEKILGNRVDLIAEPIRRVRLRRRIEEEGTRAF